MVGTYLYMLHFMDERVFMTLSSNDEGFLHTNIKGPFPTIFFPHSHMVCY